jgi:hypothetical protein
MRFAHSREARSDVDLADDLVAAQAPCSKGESMKPTPKSTRGMILSPNDWPRWPVLPMKRHGDRKPNCGLIIGDPSDGKVWFVPGANAFRADQEFIDKNAIRITIDDLIAQGWMVD